MRSFWFFCPRVTLKCFLSIQPIVVVVLAEFASAFHLIKYVIADILCFPRNAFRYPHIRIVIPFPAALCMCSAPCSSFLACHFISGREIICCAVILVRMMFMRRFVLPIYLYVFYSAPLGRGNFISLGQFFYLCIILRNLYRVLVFMYGGSFLAFSDRR